MSNTKALIDNYIQERNIKNYSLESIAISQNTDLNYNEVVFIDTCQQTGFSYYSADEYYNDVLQGVRVTQNQGFIRILSGTPILNGLKLTITELN